RFDEGGGPQERADREGAMAGIERPGADLEQQRGHQDEIVPAHEDDLDIPPALAKPLQAAGRGHTPEAAAKDHDPGLLGHRHVTSPGRMSNRLEHMLQFTARSCWLQYRSRYILLSILPEPVFGSS